MKLRNCLREEQKVLIELESYPARRSVIVGATPLMLFRIVKTTCFGSYAPIVTVAQVASTAVMKVRSSVFLLYLVTRNDK